VGDHDRPVERLRDEGLVFAAEVLAGLGAPLAGDLVVCTTIDEEWNGGGGLAAVARGVRADAEW